MVKSASLVGGLCFALAWPTVGAAQAIDPASRATARKLGYAGVEAYQAGNYAVACEKLEKAYQALRVPSLGLWSARCLGKQLKLVEASERYVEVKRLEIGDREVAVQQRALAEASTELDQLTPRIPTIALQVQERRADEVTVSIDDVRVSSSLLTEPRPVNPGKHKVVAQSRDARVEVEVTVGEAEHKPAALRFASAPVASKGVSLLPTASLQTTSAGDPKEAPPAGADPMRTLGWVGVAAGGAGIAVGAIAGAMVASKKSQLNCPDNLCNPDEVSVNTVNSYNSLRTVSTVGFVAGAALALGGVVLLVTSSPSQNTTASVWVSPTSVGFSGRF